MENNERDVLEKQVKEDSKSVLELIIREGACRMLQTAIKNEVAEWYKWYIDYFKNEKGCRNMVSHEVAA